MPEQKAPGYRRQVRKRKPALAFVEVNGNRRYFGVHNSPESLQRYDAFVAEWRSGSGLPKSSGDDHRIVELVDQYWVFAQEYHRRADGTQTSESDLIRRALSFVVKLYGEMETREFETAHLEAVQHAMIDHGRWSRKVINKMIGRVKRAFRWGARKKMVPASVVALLDVVDPVKKGRTKAQERPKVKDVPLPAIEAVLPFLSPQVAAMVQLQLFTGARPGEICIMRGCDIRMKGKTWTYEPVQHKTLHFEDDERVIHLGPKAQALVKQFLKPDLTAYLFSPAESEAWHRRERRAARRTPHHYDNGPGDNCKRSPKRRPGDHYDENAYHHAIIRACDVAFPPPEPLARRCGESKSEWHRRLTPEQRREVRRLLREQPGMQLPESLRWNRGESRREWMARLSDEQKTELKKWRRAHRWKPNQLRHTAATLLREEFGLDAAQAVLGHKLVETTQVYAEKNRKIASAAVEAIG